MKIFTILFVCIMVPVGVLTSFNIYDTLYVKPLQVEVSPEIISKITDLENELYRVKEENEKLRTQNLEMSKKVEKWTNLCPNL